MNQDQAAAAVKSHNSRKKNDLRSQPPELTSSPQMTTSSNGFSRPGMAAVTPIDGPLIDHKDFGPASWEWLVVMMLLLGGFVFNKTSVDRPRQESEL